MAPRWKPPLHLPRDTEKALVPAVVQEQLWTSTDTGTPACGQGLCLSCARSWDTVGTGSACPCPVPGAAQARGQGCPGLWVRAGLSARAQEQGEPAQGRWGTQQSPAGVTALCTPRSRELVDSKGIYFQPQLHSMHIHFSPLFHLGRVCSIARCPGEEMRGDCRAGVPLPSA